MERLLLLATRNPGKVREIRLRWADLPIEWKTLTDFPQAPEVEETGATFGENACQKALFYSAWSGLPTLGEDSGLEVDALQGAPGTRSHRFAGEGATDAERNALVLRRLEGVPWERRTARFRCALAFALPDGRCWVVEGKVEGLIAPAPRGSQGFGYDPIFYLPSLGRHMAELSPEEKNALSHRGQALDALRPLVEAWLKGHPLPPHSCGGTTKVPPGMMPG